jgi:virulence factor Mce-like protein
MTKRLLLGAVVIVALGAYLLIGGSGPSYRVQAIFDSAEGMVPGQLVKIAGVPVGSVTTVKLEPGPTALIEMSIKRRFAPFHADAQCQILPEGLISENFVQCNPGSPDQPSLSAAGGDRLPTVPLTQTSDPETLQDLLNLFSIPTDQRLAVLINELGIGTAGRGADINAILRRANPTLAQGDRVLGILDSQNQRLADAVTQTDDVVHQLGQNSGSISSFVSRAATVASTTASHRAALADAVKLLPGLLGQIRQNLAPIDQVALEGAPLLSELQAAAPQLTRLTYTLPRFASLGTPALQSLAHAARQGEGAVRAAKPIVELLHGFAATGRPVLASLDQLFISARNSGAIESVLHLLYSLATDAADYDSTSHLITALIIPFPACIADPGALGCDHQYDAPDQGEEPINNATAPTTATTSSHGSSPSPLSGLSSLLNYLLK